jgi:hypothetical protein
MNDANVITCRKPLIDASERALTPLGTAIFVGVAVVWLIATLSFAYYRWSLDQVTREAEATVLEHNRVRYVDAEGVAHETERPYAKGWSPSPGDKVRLRYVPGPTPSLEPVETAQQQRTVSMILPLFAIPMFGVAAYVHRRMQAEDARRAKLKSRDERLPALGFHIVTERVGSKIPHTEYRVLARFEHRGMQYEAPSDRFLYDPSAEIDLARLQVLLDADDPQQSMVAADTLPPRRKPGISAGNKEESGG